MKKECFNPRMQPDSGKSVFKMTAEELEEKNKELESELKKKKILLGKKKVASNNVNVANSNPNYNSNSNSNKIKIMSNFKSPTKYNSNMNNKNNDSSFISYNRENTGSPFPEKTLNKSSSNSKLPMTSFKNKLNSGVILNTSNLQVISNKTTKNMIPFPKLDDEAINEDSQIKQVVNRLKLCQKHHLPNEKNYFISQNNLKLIEEALSEKDSDINNMKTILSLTKQDFDAFQTKYKELYKVIEELNEEKSRIFNEYENSLMENKQLKENYDDFSFQYNKMLIYFKKIENFVDLVFKLIDMLNDNGSNNSSFESNNKKFNENLSQLNKIISEKELKSYVSLFFLPSESNSESESYSKNLNKKIFLLSPIDKDYLKIETQNKQLKSKLFDYETYIKKLNLLYDTKSLDLTDVVKDMITMKKRLTELDSVNENLEKENDYLRISYHNLYNEFLTNQTQLSQGKTNYRNELENYKLIEDSLKQTNRELYDKINILENANSELNENNKNLKNEIKANRFTIATSLTQEKESFAGKINELNVLVSNLNQEIAEKENIINELKMRNMEMQSEKSINGNGNKANKIITKKEENLEDEVEGDISNYLNKSDDNIENSNSNNSMKKKLMRYELEIKYLKDKIKEYEDFGADLDFKNKNKVNKPVKLFYKFSGELHKSVL